MDGYHRMACLIGADPDLSIFRRFRTSNALVLLGLQAEIIQLQYGLGLLARADRLQAVHAGVKPRDESFISISEPDAQGNLSKQGVVLQQLREKLKQFDEFKAIYQRACRAPPAPSERIKCLKKWLRSPKGGHNFLRNHETTILDDEADLTCLLGPPERDDIITRWINDKFIKLIHKLKLRRAKEPTLPLYEPHLSPDIYHAPIDYYPASIARLAVTGLNTVLSSVLPCASIFALYYVRAPVLRLSLILVLSLLFSIAMVVVAKAKKENIFGATAAFSAVLVVFVGSVGVDGCRASGI